MKRPTISKTNQAGLSTGFFSPKESEVNQMGKEIVLENVDMVNGNATNKLINDDHVGTDNHTLKKPRRNKSGRVDKWLLTLKVMYHASMNSEWLSNEQFAQRMGGGYWARNHVAKNGMIIAMGVGIDKKDVENPKGGKYRIYRIKPDCEERAKAILMDFGLI